MKGGGEADGAHRGAHASLLHGVAGAGGPEVRARSARRPADSVRRRALPVDHRHDHEDEDEELHLLLPPHSCAGLQSRGIWIERNDLMPKQVIYLNHSYIPRLYVKLPTGHSRCYELMLPALVSVGRPRQNRDEVVFLAVDHWCGGVQDVCGCHSIRVESPLLNSTHHVVISQELSSSGGGHLGLPQNLFCRSKPVFPANNPPEN
ncbi:hypothetical protein GW17_00003880 [Ensete ventricosum]|nr:hypothetical protein GW17_00003880 [Ensete ventricosum]